MSDIPQNDEEARAWLRALGHAGDGPHDIAMAALMLSALDHGGRSLDPYRSHLAEIDEAARRALGEARNAEEAARALGVLMTGQFGYDGDRLSYDAPQNADFISVIARRRGLPVALGILYMHGARAAGLKAAGLVSPGHFLLQLTLRGSEAIIDPFNGGTAIDRERLGAPPVMGAHEPDEANLTQTVSDVDVLLRLQNNQRIRALQTGDGLRGLEIANRMVLIAPRRGELWLELARLNDAMGSLGAASRAYESCMALAKPGEALHNEAALGLSGLKRRLN
ncbi:MAG TPA: transglutaminase family protein [Rhizomicrobium sp.]|nr:transglutaminase family protein [Rhizomicrobium sp.]